MNLIKCQCPLKHGAFIHCAQIATQEDFLCDHCRIVNMLRENPEAIVKNTVDELIDAVERHITVMQNDG